MVVSKALLLLLVTAILNQTKAQTNECDPPSFKINELPEIHLFDQDVRITITNDKEMECARSVDYEWRLNLIINKNEKKLVPGVLKYEESTTSTENFLTLSRADKSTPFYKHVCEISVSMTPRGGGPPSFRNQSFYVFPTHMQIKLKNGEEITHVYGSGPVILDGSESSDRSFWPTEHPMSANIIRWSCVPEIENVTPPTESLQWVIDENYLKNSKEHNCTLTVTRKDTAFFPETESASQIVRIIIPPPAEIELNCIENCHEGDAFKQTVIGWQCKKHCLSAPLTWGSIPFSEKLTQTKLVTDDKSKTVTIPPRTLRPGDRVVFAGFMGEGKGTISLSYKLIELTLKLLCVANCKTFDPRAEITLQAVCEGYCENKDYYWEAPGLNIEKYLTSSRETVTIPPKILENNQEVTVTVRNWGQEASYTLKAVEAKPLITLVCVLDGTQECGDPDPRGDIQFTAACEANCLYDEYKWEIEPNPPNFNWEDHISYSREHLNIPADTFVNEEKVVFTVTFGQTNASLAIHFLETTPTLEIKCKTNCLDPPNPMEETALEASCKLNCLHLDYKWSIPGVKSKLINSWTSSDGRNLIVPAESFNDPQKVKFILISGKGSVSWEKNYVEPIPRLSIACDDCVLPNPLELNVLKVVCDPSQPMCPLLKYTWDITPLPANFSWSSHITFGDANRSILIHEEAFQHGNVVTVTVSARKGKAKKMLTFTEPLPKMSVKCEKNCEPSHPLFPVILTAACERNCVKAVFFWSMTPLPDKFDWIHSILYQDENQTITIQPNSFKDGDKIEVVVTNRRASAKLNLRFKDTPPTIEIICDPPCNEPLNPLHRLSISANCTKFCLENETFSWHFKPTPTDFNWATSIIIQKNNESVYVMPDAFKDKDNITVEVNNGRGNVSAVLNFDEPTAEITIECVSNCWEANPLNDTNLRAVCTNECDNATDYSWEVEPAPASVVYNITRGPKDAEITIKADSYKDGDVVWVILRMRKANISAAVRFVELESQLELICVENCPPSNPFQEVKVFVECEANCIQIHYIWDLNPLPPNFKWDQSIFLDRTNRSLTISKDTFNDTDVVTVSVTSRKAKKDIIVNFLEPPVKMKISCDTCVGSTANPLHPITFNVTCIEHCERLNYIWKLVPEPPYMNWAQDAKFGTENTSLTLKEQLYLDESSVRVTVFTSKRYEFLDVYFMEPSPVLSLTCVTCLKLNEAEHTYDLDFNVTCLSECELLSYVWDISPKLRDFKWANNVKMGPKNETLMIRKNTFENLEKVLVMVKSRKGEASLEILYQSPPTFISINCTGNCNESNPFRTVVLHVQCQFECENKFYLWRIEPLPPRFDWKNNIKESENGDELTIQPNSFPDGYFITARASIDHQENTTAYMTLRFVEAIPNITLQCEENCKFNPKRPVKVQAICNHDCENLTYNWTVMPLSLNGGRKNETESVLNIDGGWYTDNNTVRILVKVRKAIASMTITYSLPEWDGDCFMEPPSGISGITEFGFECEDFKSGATFRIYQSYPLSPNKLGVLLSYSDIPFFEKIWLSTTKVEGTITVAAGEGWDTKKEFPFKAKVEPFPMLSPLNSSDTLQTKSSRRTEIESDNVKYKIFDKKEYQRLIDKREFFKAVQMASFLDSALVDTDESFRTHYKKHVIEGMLTLAPHMEPTQCLTILTKLANEKPYTDALQVRLIVEGLKFASEHMDQVRTDAHYSPAALETFATEVLSLASRLISHVSEMQDSLVVKEISPDYPVYTELVIPQADIKRHIKATTMQLFATIDALANVIQVPGDLRTVKGDEIALSVGEKRNATEYPMTLTVEGANSYINATAAFWGIKVKLKRPIVYKLVHFKVNPFWWQQTTKEINTEVLQFSVAGITQLPAPIEVFLSISDIPSGQYEGEIQARAIIEFNVVQHTVFNVHFQMVDIPYKATVGPCIPGTNSFENGGYIIDSDSKALYYINNKTIVYVGIDVPEYGSVKYRFRYTALECFYWGATELSWRREECTVSMDQIPDFIHCSCRHLSYFGARAYIPNASQRATWNDTITDGYIVNDHVIAVSISVTLSIFLILLIWAHWRDLLLKNKSAVMGLPDNVPGDKELYLVMVATGLHMNAGTTADVVFQVTGTLAKSNRHLLRADNSKTLQRNHENFFAMFTKGYLGDLKTIQLSHNSKGTKPHWYCERVIIEHLRTRKKYMFVIEKWFSLLYGSGETDGVFKVSNNRMKLPFTRKLRECLRGSHHLLTLMTQRPRGGTTKETVMVGFTSCVTVMMCVMQFMKAFETTNAISIVYIALLSSTITLPVTMTLDFLFRNSA